MYYSLSLHAASIALSRAAAAATAAGEVGVSGCTRRGAQNFNALGFHFETPSRPPPPPPPPPPPLHTKVDANTISFKGC